MKKSLMSAFGKWTGLGRKPVAFSVNQHRSYEGIDFALLSYNSGPTASLSFAFEGGSSANAPGNPGHSNAVSADFHGKRGRCEFKAFV